MFLSAIPQNGQRLMYSVALIRHPEHLEEQWLALESETEDPLTLVTARRGHDQSWRDCLDAQIASSLLLRQGRDYLLSTMPRLHHEDVVQIQNQRTEIEVAFFVTDLYGSVARAAVEQDPRTRWVTNAELRSGLTSDGRAFPQDLTTLLRGADVVRSF